MRHILVIRLVNVGFFDDFVDVMGAFEFLALMVSYFSAR